MSKIATGNDLKTKFGRWTVPFNSPYGDDYNKCPTKDIFESSTSIGKTLVF